MTYLPLYFYLSPFSLVTCLCKYSPLTRFSLCPRLNFSSCTLSSLFPPSPFNCPYLAFFLLSLLSYFQITLSSFLEFSFLSILHSLSSNDLLRILDRPEMTAFFLILIYRLLPKYVCRVPYAVVAYICFLSHSLVNLCDSVTPVAGTATLC
jgi:hypothetical protein